MLSVSLFIVTILPVAAVFLLGVPSSPPDVFTAIWMVLLTPLLEEIVFRGVLLNKLKQYGAIPAVLITAVLFSVGHLYLPNILVSLLPGVFLALIALKTGSIRYTVPLHMLVNLFCGVLLPLLYCLTG